jgi:hypothetical protein
MHCENLKTALQKNIFKKLNDHHEFPLIERTKIINQKKKKIVFLP